MASTTARKSSKDPRPTISTVPPRLPEQRLRRDFIARLVLLAALVGFVVAGALGLLGARTGSVTATGGGYRLTVQYPEITRPGLAIRWELRLSHPGGFAGPVRIDTTVGYFDLFDFNNLQALPSSVTNEGESAVWVFDPPRGDELVVNLDASMSPAVQKGTTASTTVYVGGVRQVSVTYETRVMP
jgi:hypothetical protein